MVRNAESDDEKERQAKYEQKLREQERERRRKAERRRNLSNMAHKDSMRFAEHDVDGNQELDFEEFLAMMPVKVRRTHTQAELRTWFRAADENGDGSISLTEFFRWSLAKAATTHGPKSLNAAFEFYDKDKKGTLDAREFEPLAREMGFGPMAYEVFQGLDVDKSGSISYRELVASLESNVPTDTASKQLLLSLVHSWNHEVDQEASGALNTTGWVIKGKDFETVRNELQDLLLKHGAHVVDLVKIFDQDADTELQIDDVEFTSAMRNKLGYRGPAHVLYQVFASMDLDHSGKIGFDELFEFVRGRRHCLDKRTRRVRAMKLEPPPGSDYTLDNIQWTVPTLRYLLQQMLKNCNLSVTDLIRAWDLSHDGTLSRGEFLQSVQAFFKKSDARVWSDEVREIAIQAFEEIDSKRECGTQGLIDIEEMSRWLQLPTDAKVVKKKGRLSRRSMTAGDADPSSSQPMTSRRRRLPSETQTVGDSIAAAVDRVANARLMTQQRTQHRETAMNGLPPLQRWEVPKLLELPPLTVGRVGFERPTVELSPRFGPLEPRIVPKRPSTHQLSVTRSPRKANRSPPPPTIVRPSKTDGWRPVVPRAAGPLLFVAH